MDSSSKEKNENPSGPIFVKFKSQAEAERWAWLFEPMGWYLSTIDGLDYPEYNCWVALY